MLLITTVKSYRYFVRLMAILFWSEEGGGGGGLNLTVLADTCSLLLLVKARLVERVSALRFRKGQWFCLIFLTMLLTKKRLRKRFSSF